tara:strand:- start:148 stop:369 length:222 start_codon:yes stop_codon:yes gene_type:complete
MMSILIGILIFSWVFSGIMADNYALRKRFKREKRLAAIDLARYNFVVGMLDIHQQNDLKVYLEEEAISNVTNN